MAGSILAKNTLFLTAASIGQKCIAFAYFAVLANYLGSSGNGAYFLALGLVVMIGVFDDIGLTSVLTREVARTPGDAVRWLRSVLGYKVFTIPLSIIALFVLPSTLGYSHEVQGLVIVALGIMIADTLSLTFYGVLRGLQILQYESLGIFTGQLLSTLLGIGLIVTHHATLTSLVIALTLGSCFNLIFGAWQVTRRLGIKALVPSIKFDAVLLRMALPFFLAAIFVKVYSYFDSFVLNAILGQASVGVYSVAYKLTYAFQFLPLAFVGALYPTMSAAADDPARLKKIFLDAEWYVSFLAAPIVFGIWSLAPEIISYFNPDYANAAIPLSILIFVLLPIFLDFPIGSLLNATRRQHIKTAIMGVVMVINAVANIILIPILGIAGACVAAIISFVFMFVVGWYFVSPIASLKFVELVKSVGGFYASGLVMALAVFAVKSYVPFVVSMIVGAVVYLICIFVSRAFTLDHARSFRALLRRR
jgi:O-antigen/teichoic acid export membrane protein